MKTSFTHTLVDWYYTSAKLGSRDLFLHPGLQITECTARELIHTFDVKKRLYFGNTSMDAEISLLMANQALVASCFARGKRSERP